MTAALTDAQKALFNEVVFAVVGTINPDGRPQLSVVRIKPEHVVTMGQ